MDTASYETWIGRDAYDCNGDKIGQVEAIYYDDLTSRPEWWRSAPACSGGR